MKQAVFEQIRDLAAAGRTAEFSFQADGKTLVRRWNPGERLILLGGGHIALDLCKLASMVDFRVTVVDDRPEFANRARFPAAENVLCTSFSSAIEELNIRPTDYICIITRGHTQDANCLRQILQGVMPYYLGMIGSRKRTGEQLQMLEREGFSRECLGAVHTPIGLPIHAQTTAEISISILAEMIQCRRKDSVRGSGGNVLPRSNVDRSLLDALASGGGRQIAVVVLETEGSTPGTAGSMMTVDRDGQIHGTIGGGIGEARVIQAAREMFGQERGKTMKISMTANAAESEGMACGGNMLVWMEPVE